MKGLLLVIMLGGLLPVVFLLPARVSAQGLAAESQLSPGSGLLADQPAGIRQIGADAATGSCQAVVVPEVPLAHTSQMLPLNGKGQLRGKGQLSKQVKQVFDNLDAVLQQAGSSLNQAVKVNVYLARTGLLAEVQQQFARRFAGKPMPAVSYVVGNLAHAGALVAMDAVATAAASPQPAEVRYFRTAKVFDRLPASQVAVLPAGGVVYVSGQADKGNLVEATRGTLQQLKATLEFLGLEKQQVVQLKAFTRPMADVGLVEKELAVFFQGSTMPPVVYVDWLSENPVIEIELIAATPRQPAAAPLEFLTPAGMTASPVYSKVTRINKGKKVYVSGLYARDAANAAAEVQSVFATLGDILKQAGSDFSHLAKATYYVSDNQTSTQLNVLRPRYYNPQSPPAASKAMVRGVGLAGRTLTLDMIGVVPE